MFIKGCIILILMLIILPGAYEPPEDSVFGKKVKTLDTAGGFGVNIGIVNNVYLPKDYVLGLSLSFKQLTGILGLYPRIRGIYYEINTALYYRRTGNMLVSCLDYLAVDAGILFQLPGQSCTTHFSPGSYQATGLLFRNWSAPKSTKRFFCHKGWRARHGKSHCMLPGIFLPQTVVRGFSSPAPAPAKQGRSPVAHREPDFSAG